MNEEYSYFFQIFLFNPKINNNEFKNANKLFRKIVSVPFYPALKNKEIDKVQKNLNIL